MGFLHCVRYLICLGIGVFLLGRVLPKQGFHWDQFPFLSFAWEQEGRIYERLHIRQWQNLVPDMSRIFPSLMPSKQLSHNSLAQLPEMLRETCVAEFTHFLLCLAGFCCVQIWPEGGRSVALLFLLGNLPYILIQRYNRPRLVRLLRKFQKRESQLCEF